MYQYFKGRLVEKNPTYIVVDCNGVGYYLNISLSSYETLPMDENVLIYAHHVVREDAHLLFGFTTQAEREMFRLLISVSGVGANTARMILSSLRPNEVEEAIRSENISLLQGVKGIGAKTAQRIIIDLKDKCAGVTGTEISFGKSSAREEAAQALEILGFTRSAVDKVVQGILADDPTMNVETIIKVALKKL